MGKIFAVLAMSIVFATTQPSSRPKDFSTGTALLTAGPSQHNIRSGRHVDLATDERGNLYMASFQRDSADQAMRVLVSRIGADGKPGWTVGTKTRGRATSLCWNDGSLWVTGFHIGLSEWESQMPAQSAARPFLLELDANGEPKSFRRNQPGETPMLVRALSDGSLIVVGTCTGPIRWDTHSAGRKTEDSQHYFARFDDEGRCQELRTVEGLIEVSQCASTMDGGFVIGASFHSAFRDGGPESKPRFTTTGAFDRDGLLIQFDSSLAIEWAHVIGKPGVHRKGHRTREHVGELFVRPDGDIVIAALQDSNEAKGEHGDHLLIREHSRAGEVKMEFKIDVDVSMPGSLCLASGPDSGLFVSYRVGGEQGPELVLEHRTRTGDLVRRTRATTTKNTAARTALVHADLLWIAGHVQGAMKWGKRSIENDGQHQLFWIRQPTE